MINNPGAVTGCSTLLPLKQQVSAAEPDNSKACKGAFGGLNHQHLTTFNNQHDQHFCHTFISSCVTSYISQQSVACYETVSLPHPLES